MLPKRLCHFTFPAPGLMPPLPVSAAPVSTAFFCRSLQPYILENGPEIIMSSSIQDSGYLGTRWMPVASAHPHMGIPSLRSGHRVPPPEQTPIFLGREVPKMILVDTHGHQS